MLVVSDIGRGEIIAAITRWGTSLWWCASSVVDAQEQMSKLVLAPNVAIVRDSVGRAEALEAQLGCPVVVLPGDAVSEARHLASRLGGLELGAPIDRQLSLGGGVDVDLYEPVVRTDAGQRFTLAPTGHRILRFLAMARSPLAGEVLARRVDAQGRINSTIGELRESLRQIHAHEWIPAAKKTGYQLVPLPRDAVRIERPGPPAAVRRPPAKPPQANRVAASRARLADEVVAALGRGSRRVVVHGAPGSGVSTVLRLVEARLSSQGASPVSIDLRRKGGGPMPEGPEPVLLDHVAGAEPEALPEVCVMGADRPFGSEDALFRLLPLDEAEARALFRTIRGERVLEAADLALACGNPAVIVAMAGARRDAGGRLHPLADWLPRWLPDEYRRRIDGLGPAHREVLAAACAAEGPVDPVMLRGAGCRVAWIPEVLHDLVQRGLLEDAADGPIAPAILRSVVPDTAVWGERFRAYWVARAAARIEADVARRGPLARSALEGCLEELMSALERTRAADGADVLTLARVALPMLTAARDERTAGLRRRVVDAAPPGRRGIAYVIVARSFDAGADAAIEHYATAMAELEAEGAADAAALARVELGECALSKGDVERARADAVAAYERLVGVTAHGAAHAARLAARAFQERLEPDAMAVWLDRARAAAWSAGSPALEGHVHLHAALLQYSGGRLEDARRHGQVAGEMNPTLLPYAQLIEGLIAIETDRVEDGLERLRALAGNPSPGVGALAVHALAIELLRQGRGMQAASVLDGLPRDPRRLLDEVVRILVTASVDDVALARADYDRLRAETSLERAVVALADVHIRRCEGDQAAAASAELRRAATAAHECRMLFRLLEADAPVRR